MTAKTTQCARCCYARPAQSAIGRVLGLPKPKSRYRCGSLDDAVPRDQLLLAGTVAAMLPVLAKRQECPSFAVSTDYVGSDSYRSLDLVDQE